MLNASQGYENLYVGSSGLNFGTTAAIIQQVDLIYGLLMRASIPARPYTPKSVRILQNLDEDKKLRILQDLKNWSAILISTGSSLEKIDERSLALKALKYFNLNLKDDGWQDTYADEIIEIYNPQGIQLYRSLNFFKTCGYSLLDLCVNEWFVLWERPKVV